MMQKLTRIGLIGDIHAQDVRLARAIEFFEARGVDLVASTGDVVDGGGSAERCCELIEQKHVATVRGNHDRWFLTGSNRALPDVTRPETISSRARALLEQLPVVMEIETVRGAALLCHGLGMNDMAKVTLDDYGYALESNFELQDLLRGQRYRWILNGHSHRTMVRHFGNVTIVNAGTLLGDDSATVTEVDWGASNVRVFAVHDDGTVAEVGTPIPLGCEELLADPVQFGRFA